MSPASPEFARRASAGCGSPTMAIVCATPSATIRERPDSAVTSAVPRPSASPTAAGVREVDLSLDLGHELNTWRAERRPVSVDELVFATDTGRPRDKDSVRERVLVPVVNRVNEIRRERGLAPLLKITPHALRRTYISLMLEAGAASVRDGPSGPRRHYERRGTDQREHGLWPALVPPSVAAEGPPGPRPGPQGRLNGSRAAGELEEIPADPYGHGWA
jgi:hypothetical protein